MPLRNATSGDYIGGQFLGPEGEAFSSYDPAHEARVVFSTGSSPDRIGVAVDRAREAQRSWQALGLDARFAVLARFRKAIESRKEPIADAIVNEIGKLRSEARLEVASLVGRFDLSLDRIRNDLRDGALPGFPNEALRWQPHGVVGVIGPFNFPVHLSHAHIVPALLLGNTVVLKPSEVAPLCAVRYAEAAHEAGLPPGVFNLVQGRAASGMALVTHPDVKAIAFTGSWPVGRKILEATLDKPETLLALEMGGKNVSIVCEDADLRQAAHEIVIGGYLTTGQRCTCTDRVLVHKSKAKALIEALRRLVRSLHFGDPDDETAFAGPMATEGGLIKLERAIDTVRAAGADAVVPGERKSGGTFRTGSLHVLPAGVHHVPGYTDVELFGPDLGLEVVDDDDEAISIVRDSPYGFACSVFTASDERFFRYRSEIRLGLINRNRSTNQASPRLPFGGTGRSGNFRPAGAFAARNLAVPVAVQSNVLGAFPASPHLRSRLPPPDLDLLETLHAGEEAGEAAHRVSPLEQPRATTTPLGGVLPRSTALLERFYAGDRFVRDKRPMVIDPFRSRGPRLVSIDDEPLTVLDASPASPLGYGDDALVRAYVEGAFGDTMLRAHDITAPHGVGHLLAEEFAIALRALVPGLPTVCFTASASEARHKACALAMPHGPAGATRLLSFEGGAHSFAELFEPDAEERAPFPAWDGNILELGGPPEPRGLMEVLAQGDLEALESRWEKDADLLLRAEVRSLAHVARRLKSGEIYAVLIEPMQARAGDRYATPRFHRALHLLCRVFSVPHLVDESECGFGLGGSFAWHPGFGFVDGAGAPDTPDCVIFAERAEAGVVMSRHADPEPSRAHPASLVRGRLFAALVHGSSRHGGGEEASRIEAALRPFLAELSRRFSHLVHHPRARGFALAFDLETRALRDAFLGQALWRGVIPAGRGERTVTYRLHAGFQQHDLEALFQSVHRSLSWLDAHPGKKPPPWEDLDSREPTAVAGAPVERGIGPGWGARGLAAGQIDCGTLAAPFEEPPGSLLDAQRAGLLLGPTTTRLRVNEYLTSAVVRATEWAAALAPDLPHVFLTPGQDELIDKTVRLLRSTRKSARVLLSLEGTYVGHTTACARSSSDPRTHHHRGPRREWPRISHPAEVGVAEAIAALRNAITSVGAEAVLGVLVETIGERTGKVTPDEYLEALSTLRKETGVPIVVVETASAYYRSGRGAFHSSSLQRTFLPDVLAWWTGGQLGFLHVASRLVVAGAPSIGTDWDGDELSLIQAHHNLRAARSVEAAGLGAALGQALEKTRVPVHGAGLYRVLAAGDRATEIAERLAVGGVIVKRYPGSNLVVAPPLDRAEEAIARLEAVLV